MNRIGQGGANIELLVMQLSETEAALGPSWEKNFTKMRTGQQADFAPFLGIERTLDQLIAKGRTAGIQDLADSVESAWKMYKEIIPLIVNLSRAETSLRNCWNQTFERLRFSKQCNFSPISTFTPPIPRLIREGREALDGLQTQTHRSFNGIQELIDSVTALWDSFAEVRGFEKIALVPTVLPNPFFPISPPSPHGPPSSSSSSTLKNQETTHSSSSTPTTQRNSSTYHDPLLPLQIDTDDDDDIDWEIVSN